MPKLGDINNPTGKGGFKKGQVANPNGRPKTGESFTDIYNRLLEENFIEITKDEYGNKVERKTNIKTKDILCQAVIRHALRGSVGHLREIAERTEGKIEDALKLKGDKENPIEIKEIKINLVTNGKNKESN